MDNRWEYLLEEIHGQSIGNTLNRLGQEGWELVQIVGSTHYFKREKRQMKPAWIKHKNFDRQENSHAPARHDRPSEAAPGRFMADPQAKNPKRENRPPWLKGKRTDKVRRGR